MSLFDWLTPKPAIPQSTGLPSDALSVPSPATATAKPHVATPPPEDNLKVLRIERREQLYAVVRSAMLRSEILAANYKFKVLSLDLKGRQFLVMVDLQNADVLPASKFAELEHLIAANAAQQHDLQVKAVYWRVADQRISALAPSPTSQVNDNGATVASKPSGHTSPAHRTPAFEPINPDEVLAFQRAVAAATVASPAVRQGQAITSGPRLAPAPHGFEDTQLLDPDDAASPLSRTQFGNL